MGWSLGTWLAFVAIVGAIGTFVAWVRHDSKDGVTFRQMLVAEFRRIMRESKS